MKYIKESKFASRKNLCSVYNVAVACLKLDWGMMLQVVGNGVMWRREGPVMV